MQDMTKGSITKHLIAYMIPMILGNVLQLTYNAADSIIIGKFLGENALAAVSTSNPIITILVLGASGLSLGASVLISRFRGARDEDSVRREFSTTLLFGAVFSLAFFLAGTALARPLLRWIRTPEEVLSPAVLYLRIYLVGFLFTFQYNVFSAALRGIGDSKTPVYFLAVSCTLNIGLDLLLVVVIPLGVAGAAVATVLAQAIAAVACMVYIHRRIPMLRLGRGQWRIDPRLLSQTLRIGSLTALQQAAQPIGKVCIQSVINAQGIVAIDAFNAACRIDDFARIPTQSIGNSIMTSIAQNAGAEQPQRIRESFRKGVCIALIYYPIIFLIVQLLKVPAVTLLSPDGNAAIVDAGVSYLGLKAFFFVMPCLTNAIQGQFRGLGQMKIVLVGTVLQTGVRTLCVYFWVPAIGINGEAYACFVGWLCQCILQYGLYFYRLHRNKTPAP